MKRLCKTTGIFLSWALFVFFGASLSSCVHVPFVDMSGARPGEFSGFSGGTLYLPADWNPEKEGGWPVTIVLPGYSGNDRSFSAIPVWQTTADERGIVLFFMRRDHMGWHEFPESGDSRQINAALKFFRSQKWVKNGGLNLFGFSAGAIMATGYLARNGTQADGRPLFDCLSAVSGGIGTQLEKDLEKDPQLNASARIPVFLSWGESEPPLVGVEVYRFLAGLGWDVTMTTHPGGHFITPGQIEAALKFSAGSVP